MRVTLGVTRIDGFQARRWFRARRAGRHPGPSVVQSGSSCVRSGDDDPGARV